MKKLLLLFCLLASLAALLPSACADKLCEVEKSNYIEFDGDDNAYYFARVKNISTTPLYSDSSDLIGFSEDGDILISESYVHTYPYNIQIDPGQYVYVREYIWDSALKGGDVSDLRFSFHVRNYGTNVKTIPSSVTWSIDSAVSYGNYIYVTLTNNSRETIDSYYIVAALYDKDDNLVFVNGDSMEGLSLHPNSTITVRIYIDKDLIDYYRSHNIEIASADSIVYLAE